MGRKEMYESVLKKFSTVITESEGHYIVTYGHGLFEGTCKYMVKSGMSRLQPQSVLLLTETDMGDVIEYIHKEYPLSLLYQQSLNLLLLTSVSCAKHALD
jgi:hypothetical protein